MVSAKSFHSTCRGEEMGKGNFRNGFEDGA